MIRGLFNTNTFVLSLEPHNRALPVGKVKHEKPYNRLAAWEMNLLSQLRRQLPLRGELWHPERWCFAFLETAPLSPFGHFPPLGAACDVKKKLKSNLSWTYIGSPCFEAGFLDSDGYHRTSVIRFSFTVNVFKSPSIISVLNDFGRFWPAQRGGSSLSLYWRWWKECSSTSAARFACFPSAVRLV